MANEDKIVIIAALDGTYLRKRFNTILDLIPIAEDVVKLTAICSKCYESASFSYRHSAEKDVEVIGGLEKYYALCRKCYLQEINK